MTKTKWPAEVIVCREGEQALQRIQAGTAEPGDGFKLAKAGLDDPDRQEADKDRLAGVAFRMRQRGTDAEFKQSRDSYNSATIVNGQIVADFDSELAKLQARLTELRNKKQAAQDDTAVKERDFQDRNVAHQWLQSDDAMPPLIRVEIQAQRHSMRNAIAQRANELTNLVANLRADGGRLTKSTVRHGDDIVIENEYMLADYVAKAQADSRHRGHEYWRDRVFSRIEWGGFNSWCKSRADKLQTELDAIKHRAEADIAESLEGLSSFYVADVE